MEVCKLAKATTGYLLVMGNIILFKELTIFSQIVKGVGKLLMKLNIKFRKFDNVYSE